MLKEKILDLTDDNCPMIFVKTKVFLQETNKNDIRILKVKGISNKNSLTKTLCELGFNVSLEDSGNNIFKIFLN